MSIDQNTVIDDDSKPPAWGLIHHEQTLPGPACGSSPMLLRWFFRNPLSEKGDSPI